MQGLMPWLPTIVTLLTAALALGGSKNQLTTIADTLKDLKVETSKLGAQVQETITAKVVTGVQMDAISTRLNEIVAKCALQEGHIAELRDVLARTRTDVFETLRESDAEQTRLRHSLRDEINAVLARCNLSPTPRP